MSENPQNPFQTDEEPQRAAAETGPREEGPGPVGHPYGPEEDAPGEAERSREDRRHGEG